MANIRVAYCLLAPVISTDQLAILKVTQSLPYNMT